MKGRKHPASVCVRSSGWNGASSAQLRACSAAWAGSLQLAPNEPHQTNKQRKRLHKLVPKTSTGWILRLCAVPTSPWTLGMRGVCPNVTPQSVGQLLQMGHSPFFWGLQCKTAVPGDEPLDSLEKINHILRYPHHWWQQAVQILCKVVVSCSRVVRSPSVQGAIARTRSTAHQTGLHGHHPTFLSFTGLLRGSFVLPVCLRCSSFS